jgi:hypothetical protein
MTNPEALVVTPRPSYLSRSLAGPQSAPRTFAALFHKEVDPCV